jgi:hypothetical protein
MRAGYWETVSPFLLSIERGKVDVMVSAGEDLSKLQDGCLAVRIYGFHMSSRRM